MKTTKRPTKQAVLPPTDAEIRAIACQIAVQRGLALPETEEEVAIFERVHAEDLTKAACKTPRPLQEVLARATAREAQGGVTLILNEVLEEDEPLAMAARNGTGEISDESLRIMLDVMRGVDEDD